MKRNLFTLIALFLLNVAVWAQTSGSCGENGSNVTWSISNNVLTFSGSGRMADYMDDNEIPWWSQRNSITKIVINSGVTYVGFKAGYQCTNVTSVQIPATVTEIGPAAFSQIKNLTTVTIPSKVTKIGYAAFQGCSKLATVNIQSTVLTSIESWAFATCTALTRFTIPASVTSIGKSSYGSGRVFYGSTGLQTLEILSPTLYTQDYSLLELNDQAEIIVPIMQLYNYKRAWSEAADRISAVGNIPFADAAVKALCVANWDTNADGELSPAEALNVKDLGTVFKGNTQIKQFDELMFFEGLTSIADNAFSGCSALTSIVIPSKVKSIGSSAFSGCSSLTSVEIPNSVTGISPSAFRSCTSLTSVELPNSVTSIGDSAFDGCSSLTSVEIPNSVTSIGNRAFEDCSRLTSVEIPNSVVSIGSSAFSGCSSLTSIVVAPNNPKYDSRDNCNAIIESESNTLIAGCQNSTIPNSVTSIGSSAFMGCSRLTSVELPNSVTSIGSSAFRGCSSLTSEELPNSVTSIGNRAFHGCSSLTSVEIGNSVTSIGDGTFYGCSSLTSVELPNSVKSIDMSAFEDCSRLTSVVIPNSVTSIDMSAFYNCSSLTSVEIGNSVTSIGRIAFSRCSGLTKVRALPTTAPSTREPATIFNNCTNLTTIYIPKGSMASYNVSPWNAYNLIETRFGNITFADVKVKELCVANWDTNGDGELSYIEALEVTDLGTVFKQNTEITQFNELQYFEGLTSIGQSAFEGCAKLTSIVLPNTIQTIGRAAFKKCVNLQNIVLPNSLTTIDYAAFDSCESLKSIDIPNSVTSIGDWAFTKCYALKAFVVPASVTNISGVCVLQRCKGLESIVVEEGNPKYDSRENCNAIIRKSDNTLLAGCKNTVIPSGIVVIKQYAFADQAISDFVIPNTVTTIENNVFEGCTELTEIELPASVTSIGKKAFYKCSALTKVSMLPTTAPSTTEPATIFEGCTNLTTIHVPKGCMASYNVSPWNAFDIVEIPEYMTLVDGEAYAGEEEKEYDAITYTRNFKNTYYQPLYVPFDINYDDIKDRFAVAELNDIHHYDDDEDGVYDRWALEVLRLKSGDVVQANTPYVIKAKTTGEQSIVVEDAILYPAELNTIDCSSTKVLFTFEPTYTAISGSVLREDGGYVLGSGKLLIPTESTTVKPFRWYLRSESRNGGGQSFAPKQILLFERGEGGLTHIENFTEDANHASWPADVYDTNGRLIRKAARNLDGLRGGVYIVNGKKIVK